MPYIRSDGFSGTMSSRPAAKSALDGLLCKNTIHSAVATVCSTAGVIFRTLLVAIRISKHSRCNSVEYQLFRMVQSRYDSDAQPRTAAPMTATAPCRGRNCQTTRAKAARPQQPRTAPEASMLAANLPRNVPSTPISALRRFSLFSIMVALAGKIAGNARKRPPIPGP